MIIQSILSNVAIILLMHLTMTFILTLKNKVRPIFVKSLIVLLVSSSVIAMFYLPIRFGDYWVDMRFIPLVFLTYIQGGKVGIPSLLIASAWRYFMGGSGMVPGILFGMVGPTLLALAFHHRAHLKNRYLEKLSIVIGAWLICDVPIIFIIPDGWTFFKSIAVIRFVSFVGTAIILYTFILMDRERNSLNEKLRKMAGEDPLTKLLNKRKFFEVVEEKVKKLSPNHYFAMVDLDHFKKLNDTFGHLAGDKILIGVANVLRSYECERIQVGRFGGEEFIIYIGQSSLEEATEIAESIREQIKAFPFYVSCGEPVHVTVSVGLAELARDDDIMNVVHSADQCLYKAKRKGRDRLVTSGNFISPSRNVNLTN